MHRRIGGDPFKLSSGQLIERDMFGFKSTSAGKCSAEAHTSQYSGRRKTVYRVMCLLFGSLISLALAETALRVVDRPHAPIAGWKWEGDPTEANEFGFRGHRRQAQADSTVLLLGDSQVETSRPFHTMPEVFLGETLRQLTKRDVRVVSVGSYGWGQDQQLLALQKYLREIKPRDVALWFQPVNDFWNNTFPTHFPKDGRAKPTFWLEGDTLRGPNTPWMATSGRHALYLLRLWDRARGFPQFITDEEWEARLPPPYQTVPCNGQCARSLREFLAGQRGISPHDVPYFSEENFSNEKTHYSISLYPESPRLAYSVKLTRLLLLEILKVCRENGARLTVFYIDDRKLIPDEPANFEVDGKSITLSGISAKNLINEVLTGIPTLRIQGLPANSTTSNTDSHLNEAGNKYVMSELAHWLVNIRALPSSY